MRRFGFEGVVLVDWKGGPLHRLAAVPLVLSGSLCPFGTSPHPVGSHPFQGRLLGMGRILSWIFLVLTEGLLSKSGTFGKG